MPRVIHFEIHAGEPERAIEFYKTVFGWEFTVFDGPEDYWSISTGPEHERGIDGGLIRRRGELDAIAVIAFVCTVEVDSVDLSAAKIAGSGGTLVGPKIPIAGTGWLMYCKDTEGNIFGILEQDPNVE
jgi:predicted enzyme related to lactoylglutathione lyase